MDQKFLEKPYYNLYLVRHGLSYGNFYHIFGGWMDLPLHDQGIAELKEFKKSIPYPKEVDLYVSSGQKRAIDTMEIITGKAGESRPDWRFSESYYGICEGSVPEDEVENEEFYEKFYRSERQGYGEETFADQARRCYRASMDLLSELKKNTLNSAYVFCHYGTIKASVFNFLSGKEMTLNAYQLIPNGSLWHFLFKDEDGKMDCKIIRSYMAGNYSEVHMEADELSGENTLLEM